MKEIKYNDAISIFYLEQDDGKYRVEIHDYENLCAIKFVTTKEEFEDVKIKPDSYINYAELL